MKVLFALLLLGVVPSSVPTYSADGKAIATPAPSSSPMALAPLPCAWILDRLKLHHGGKIPKMETRLFMAELYATSLELHGFTPTTLHPQQVSRALLLQGAVDLVGCFGV